MKELAPSQRSSANCLKLLLYRRLKKVPEALAALEEIDPRALGGVERVVFNFGRIALQLENPEKAGKSKE